MIQNLSNNLNLNLIKTNNKNNDWSQTFLKSYYLHFYPLHRRTTNFIKFALGLPTGVWGIVELLNISYEIFDSAVVTNISTVVFGILLVLIGWACASRLSEIIKYVVTHQLFFMTIHVLTVVVGAITIGFICYMHNKGVSSVDTFKIVLLNWRAVLGITIGFTFGFIANYGQSWYYSGVSSLKYMPALLHIEWVFWYMLPLYGCFAALKGLYVMMPPELITDLDMPSFKENEKVKPLIVLGCPLEDLGKDEEKASTSVKKHSIELARTEGLLPISKEVAQPESSKKGYKLDPAVKAIIQQEGLSKKENFAVDRRTESIPAAINNENDRLVTKFVKSEMTKLLNNENSQFTARLEEERTINTEKAVIKVVTEMRAKGHKHPIERSVMMHALYSKGTLANLVVFDPSSTNIKINVDRPISNLSNLNIITMSNAGIADISDSHKVSYYNDKDIQRVSNLVKLCRINTENIDLLTPLWKQPITSHIFNSYILEVNAAHKFINFIDVYKFSQLEQLRSCWHGELVKVIALPKINPGKFAAFTLTNPVDIALMNNVKIVVDLARDAMPIGVPVIGALLKDGVQLDSPRVKAAVFTAILVPALAEALRQPEPISGYAVASYENDKWRYYNTTDTKRAVVYNETYNDVDVYDLTKKITTWKK